MKTLEEEANEILDRFDSMQNTKFVDIVNHLVHRGIKVSEKNLNRAIDHLNPGCAARLALKAGLIDKAIEIYETRGFYADAAITAENYGLTDRAISIWEKNGCFVEAAVTAKKAKSDRATGLYLKAIAIDEKAGRYENAADLAKDAGLTEKAIDLYEKNGQFCHAAEAVVKAGLLERAVEDYVKGEHFSLAAHYGKQIGLPEDKIKMYEILADHLR